MQGYLVCALANQSEVGRGSRSTVLSVSQIWQAVQASWELIVNSCAFFECVVIISKQSAHDLSSCPAGPLITPSFVNCKIEAKITGSRNLKLVAYVAFFCYANYKSITTTSKHGVAWHFQRIKAKNVFQNFEKEKIPQYNSVITTSKHVTSFSWALQQFYVFNYT